MTKFEDQLYADLMLQHGSVLAATKPPASPRRHIASRGTLLATGAGGVAVAATASVLATGGGTPAYALTTNHDTITLAVYQASGIAQANAKLRQLGDHVVVVPVRAGCPSLGSLPAPAVRAKDISVGVGGSRSSNGSITVNAHGVPAGDILVVAIEVTAQGTQAAAGLTSPPAPSCVSLPALPPGSGGPGSGSMSGSGGGPGSSAVPGSGSVPSLSLGQVADELGQRRLVAPITHNPITRS
jgi:hypothetical protein